MTQTPPLRTRRAWTLFLLAWALFGLTTSLANLRAYTLQQMGVDALVSHGTFTLGHSQHPMLQPLGDTFEVDGRVLAAKQPGQFVIGALPYTVLKPLGISYEADYDRASAWVTWLSSGLLAALALVVFDGVLLRLGFTSGASLVAVAAFGIGSHWLAYAGIAHHDVIATALLVFAASAAQRGRVFVAGLLLGLVLFVSMLPALIVAVAGIALAWRAPKQAWRAALGFALGVAPLLAYNAWYFGSALVPANVAGNYADTFPAFDLARIAHHANAYFGTYGLALWRYSPALIFGIVGLLLPGRGQLRAWLLAAAGLHLAYLFGIETLGTCQFGPRYLLPLLPMFALGVAALVDRHRPAMVGLIALVAIGFAINLVGAIGGSMYCQLETWALPPAWARLSAFDATWLPLRWLALIAALAGLACAFAPRRQNWK